MNYMQKGLLLIVIALVFNLLETWYFGWNMLPKSIPEAYCDGISGIVSWIGFFMIYGYSKGRGEEDKD